MKCAYRLNCKNYFIKCDECENYEKFSPYFTKGAKPDTHSISIPHESIIKGREFEKEIAKKIKGHLVPASGAGFWKGDIVTKDYYIEAKFTLNDSIYVKIQDVLDEIQNATRIKKEWRRFMKIKDKYLVIKLLDEEDQSLCNNAEIKNIGSQKGFYVRYNDKFPVIIHSDKTPYKLLIY